MMNNKSIETVVNEIKSNKKYKVLSLDTITNVVMLEIQKHKTIKNAIKSSKKKLHLILADYLSQLNYALAEKDLKAAFLSGDCETIRQTCLDIMSKHASTRERLDILEEFYPRLLKITGEPKKLADLACALNPFSYRWMGLPENTAYFAFDNNIKNIELLNLYFQLENIDALAEVRDILCHPLKDFFDIGLLFKMYHCLEHRQKGAGWEVIKNTPTRWMVVSFPTRNLANRKSDIFGNYKEEILSNIKENNWDFQIVEFQTEKVLLIKKGA